MSTHNDLLKIKILEQKNAPFNNALKEGKQNLANYLKDEAESRLRSKIYSENAQELENKKQREFLLEVKKELLYECVKSVFESAIKVNSISLSSDNVLKSYFANYIKDKNIDTVLKGFKFKTILLDEVALFIDEACSKVKKEMTDDEKFATINAYKSNMADMMTGNGDFSKISNVIKTSVIGATKEFIKMNNKKNEEIDEINNKAKKEIEKYALKQNIAESIQQDAKLAKRKILTEQPKTIFEAMVRNITNDTLQNEQIKEFYSNSDGSLDMDSIIEMAIIAYGFNETLNVLKIEEMTEEKILEMYNSLI